jgi:hypothetical protein
MNVHSACSLNTWHNNRMKYTRVNRKVFAPIFSAIILARLSNQVIRYNRVCLDRPSINSRLLRGMAPLEVGEDGWCAQHVHVVRAAKCY